MAKEMMIVFVYDTQCCVAEEDDPIDAVLYFHPGWVSDTQRHALAGQVVGAAHCVKSLFSPPVAITLQSGKFIIKEFGRYILAVGSDRNIPDWVLQNRARLLTSILKVYHGDLNTIAAQFVEDKKRFADKLYQIFETYLPVLQYGCHIFQRVPMLNLPKTAASVFMESMMILEQCRRFDGILGGIVLYNNKIVATQLPPSLTSYLTVVDPYRIKSPSMHIEDVSLPLGGQLLKVYIKNSAFKRLKNQSKKAQEFQKNGEEMIAGFKKIQESEREKLREFPQSGMKRDKSLLFTAVPEEDHTMISPPSHEQTLEERKPQIMPDVVPFTNKPRQRPTKLSLSFKTQMSLEEDIKEEKVYTGQTSVCSTPMVEYKKLHGNVLSICQNPDGQLLEKSDDAEPDIVKNVENSAKLVIENDKVDNKIVLDFNSIADHYVNKPEPMRKLASVTDLQETIRRISNRATSKFKLKKTKLSSNVEISLSPDDSVRKGPSTMTINDPSFPVFRNDGVAISESLFNQYLEQHYSRMKEEIDLSKQDNMFTFNQKLVFEEKFEGFDSEVNKSPIKHPVKIQKIETPTMILPSDQSKRKSLSLPLKSLSENNEAQNVESDPSGFRKKLSGVQLTPLMEKLSQLACSDKSSGYGSRAATPLDLREFVPPIDRQVPTHRNLSESEDTSSDDEEEPDCKAAPNKECFLLVCGASGAALLALADDTSSLLAVWEAAQAGLDSVERQCLEAGGGQQEEPLSYSFLAWDEQWGAVKRGGSWPPNDIAAMGLTHDAFRQDSALSQLTLRSGSSCLGGFARAGAVAFHAEAASATCGPPAPADALAQAAPRAAARLRHQGLTLL